MLEMRSRCLFRRIKFKVVNKNINSKIIIVIGVKIKYISNKIRRIIYRMCFHLSNFSIFRLISVIETFFNTHNV